MFFILLLILLLFPPPPVLAQMDSSSSLDQVPERYLQDVPSDSIIAGYLCPMHPEVTAEKKGRTCYLCGMALVDGRIKRPHGSHDPHFGGIFFMARDAWHHIEGTMPAPGLFRLHLYDNYSRPMTVANVSARLVFQEFRDEDGNQARPPIETPMTPGPDGVTLLVSDRRVQLGRDFHIMVRVEADQAEEDRFDFAFYQYSNQENAGMTEMPSERSPTSALIIPESARDILSAMLERVDRVKALIRRSTLNEIFIPALEAKDLALALLDNPGSLDEDRLITMQHAVKVIVKAAWWLDTYGDYGDKPEAEASFREMRESAEQIRALYR